MCSLFYLIMHIYNDSAGKFGAVFASIPSPIFAALYCLFFAYVGMFKLQKLTSSNLFKIHFLQSGNIDGHWPILQLRHAGGVGVSFLQFCNLNSFRTKFILGFSIFLGFSIPQYFNEYTAIKGYGPVHTSGRWVGTIIYLPLKFSKFVSQIFEILKYLTLFWFGSSTTLLMSRFNQKLSLLAF